MCDVKSLLRFLSKNYNCTVPNSNRTLPKSNILLIIFKAVPDHDHDRSFDKNINMFYIKINDFLIF
jgi:hypothetical protein